MAAHLLRRFFAFIFLHLFTEGALIGNCDSNRKYVEGYNNLSPWCNVNSTSTVRWTLVNDTGATLHLGTCYGQNNCKNPYSSSDLRVIHQGRHSYVHFFKIASQFSGVLTCQETQTNGNVLTDTCQLNVARVSFQSTYQVDIRENATRYINCYNSPYTYNTSTVTWSLTTTSGQTLDLGTCTDVNTCTSPHAPDITLQRPYNYMSQVNVKMVDRSKSGELFCSYTYNGLRETANATINVYSPATVRNCHAEVRRENWSSILSCDISNVFSSSGEYNFSVLDTFQVLKHGTMTSANGYVFDGRLSYRDVLTPYTNSTDNKVYYRGRLTYSWPLSPIQLIYTSLTVYVYSGFSTNTGVGFGYTVNITAPSQPTHNCSGLKYIPETDVVPCVCTADNLGSPAGRLVWLLGNITIATGDYGVTQLTFPSGKVSRQHDEMMVRCQLDWVQPINTAFIRHVASFSQSHTERDQFNWTAVGVGVALGLVVIILVVVIIAFYRRGRLCRSPTPNAPTSTDDEDSHCYTSLKLSKATKNKRNGAEQGVTCPPAIYQGDGDSVYENAAMEGQEGHM